MNKILVVGLMSVAFFVGAFVDRQLAPKPSEELAAARRAESEAKEQAVEVVGRMQQFINELRAPLKARPMRTPLSTEAVDATKFKLESDASTYLIYRCAPTPASEGNVETAVPVAMLRQEPDGLWLYVNFKIRESPQKEIRLRIADEKTK